MGERKPYLNISGIELKWRLDCSMCSFILAMLDIYGWYIACTGLE
jgi:hypothetical protein